MTILALVGWVGALSLVAGLSLTERVRQDLPRLDLNLVVKARDLFWGGLGLVSVWAALLAAHR